MVILYQKIAKFLVRAVQKYFGIERLRLTPKFSMKRKRKGGLPFLFRRYILCTSEHGKRTLVVCLLLEFQAEIVGDQRDKFRIGGLALGDVYGVAENFC